MIGTTIEQSKHLIELGLDINTSDMCYPKDAFSSTYDEEPVCHSNGGIGVSLPAWSLTALLKLIPKKIQEVKDHDVELIIGYPKDSWNICYFDWTGLQHGPDFHSENDKDNLVETAYTAVVWLLEHGYIKKKINI